MSIVIMSTLNFAYPTGRWLMGMATTQLDRIPPFHYGLRIAVVRGERIYACVRGRVGGCICGAYYTAKVRPTDGCLPRPL